MVLVCRLRGSDIHVQFRIPLLLPLTFSASGRYALLLFCGEKSVILVRSSHPLLWGF